MSHSPERRSSASKSQSGASAGIRSWRAWSLGTTREILSCVSSYLGPSRFCQTHLELGVVRYRGLAVFARHGYFEDAELVLGHWCRIAVPVVEVTNQVCSQGVRRPLAVQNVAVGLDQEAEALVALRGGQQKWLYSQLGGAHP